MTSSLSLGRLVLLSWLWLLATLAVQASGATVYSLYDIPPFSVTFQTQPTDALEAALRQLPSGDTLVSETNGRSSGLSFPLRSVTQTFLYEEFKAKIISLENQENARDPAQQYEWFPIYVRLVGVDLSVRLYWVEGGTFQNQSRDRDRRLTSQVTLRAECNGLLAFQESDAPTPSNEQVMQMFGDWMELIFSQHRDAYLRDLVQSEYDLLRQIAALDIATNIGSASESSSATTQTSWSDRTQKALFTMLILLAVAAFAYTTLVVHQTLRKRRLQAQRDVTTLYEDEEEYDFSIDRPAPINSNLRSTSMDAVRHGPDVFHRSSYSGAMSVLEHTDKYLAKHRPDLYQPETSSNFSLLGREYTIPSNPFEFIYNAFSEPKDFTTSPQGAFSAPRRMPSRSENIAAMRPLDEVEEDELHLQEEEQPWKTQSIGYRPISSIWRNITTMWDYDTVRPRLNEDGIVNHTPQRSVDMELQTVNFVDMHESDYDFPFKDFPRHDGTPCLIFNEGAHLTSKQREIFEIGSPIKNNDDEKNDLLSDEEFQRMLAQQANASPNDSMIESSFQDQDSSYTDFKEKLTRLMQQKHRQYEKRAIVEKHQERRAKERKSVRELEKQEKHKAMERQIDDLEAAFTSNTLVKDQLKHSPKPTRWTTSPNPYVAQRYSPKPTTQQSPFRHSTYSPYRNGNASGASPFRTSNPSPNIVNRSSPNPGIDYKNSFDREGIRYRPSSNSPLQHEQGHASMPSIGMDESRPFRMRPRTSHPLHATTGPSDLYMDPFAPPTHPHQLDNTIDHNTLDKLSMPPMTINGNNNNPKYPSPNSVNDDIFAGAPTSISRRKTNAGTAVPKPVHRRVNSMDNKLGIDRPVPQQRRKTKVNKSRTSTPTRDHSLPRSSTPNQRSMTSGPLTPLTGLARREPSFTAQDHHSSASSLSSTKRSSTLSRSNSFNASEDNIFTHGFASQSRFV